MGVLDKFLDAIKLNDDYDDDEFLDEDLDGADDDDDFLDDEEEARPKKKFFEKFTKRNHQMMNLTNSRILMMHLPKVL